MPRKFNWTQAQHLVDEYLSGDIPSARNLYNRMRETGIHISKNTVYSRVRGELKAVSYVDMFGYLNFSETIKTTYFPFGCSETHFSTVARREGM